MDYFGIGGAAKTFYKTILMKFKEATQ